MRMCDLHLANSRSNGGLPGGQVLIGETHIVRHHDRAVHADGLDDLGAGQAAFVTVNSDLATVIGVRGRKPIVDSAPNQVKSFVVPPPP